MGSQLVTHKNTTKDICPSLVYETGKKARLKKKKKRGNRKNSQKERTVSGVSCVNETGSTPSALRSSRKGLDESVGREDILVGGTRNQKGSPPRMHINTEKFRSRDKKSSR